MLLTTASVIEMETQGKCIHVEEWYRAHVHVCILCPLFQGMFLHLKLFTQACC